MYLFEPILTTVLAKQSVILRRWRENLLSFEVAKVLSERRQVKGLLPSLVDLSRKHATIEARQLG